MLNNKGQSLVLFVLLLPILFLILVLVVDIGKMVLLRQELDNINFLAIDYGIDNLDNTEVEMLVRNIINKNKKDIDTIDIKIEDNKIYVVLEDKINNMFYKVSGIDLLVVKSSYVGYLDMDNKKVIERDK